MPKYLNSFPSPKFVEETVVDSQGAVIGVIRIKPSGVLWKPKGQQKFYTVPLDKFVSWITAPGTRATRTKS